MRLLTEFGRADQENIWLEIMTRAWAQHLITTKNWQLRKFCFNLNRAKQTGARGATKRKENCNIFESEQETHKKRVFSFFYSFLSSFCGKAVWAQGRTAFSGSAHVYSSGLTHFNFRYVFYKIARAGPNGSYDKRSYRQRYIPPVICLY